MTLLILGHYGSPWTLERVARCFLRLSQQTANRCGIEASYSTAITLIGPDFGNWYGCVGNFCSCQRQIFPRFPEGHRFKTLNVPSAKQESFKNAITWQTGNLWLLLRLRFLENGMPISTVPTAANGISCKRKRPGARPPNSGAMLSVENRRLHSKSPVRVSECNRD